MLDVCGLWQWQYKLDRLTACSIHCNHGANSRTLLHVLLQQLLLIILLIGYKKSVPVPVPRCAVLVAGVLRTSDPRRPALEALPNLSLNVSDALRATRAE